MEDKDLGFSEAELMRISSALAAASKAVNDALPTTEQAGKKLLEFSKALRESEFNLRFNRRA